MARPTTPIILNEEQKKYLQSIVRSREISHSLVIRSQIILKASQGNTNKAIGKTLNIIEETVSLWRKRWIENIHKFEKFADKPKQLQRLINQTLSDKPRSGKPCHFSAEQICQLIALACESPPEYLSHWTQDELVKEAIKRNITQTISKTTIGRFLKSGRFKATS